MSQFKNYTRGERTNRLYIKNLAKQVSEQVSTVEIRGIMLYGDGRKSLLRSVLI